MSSSQSKACFWLSLLISSMLISLNVSEGNTGASFTVEKIELLYNQVLQSSIDNCQTALQQLNDTSNAIDKQYFIELDKLVGSQDYYSTAYFIFALIHSSLFNQQSSDQLLLAVLPTEKASIRQFFSKVRKELLAYFTYTHQVHLDLMQNVTLWQNESADSLLLSYLEFPQTLQNQVPELRLVDYLKQAKGIVEGIARELQLT
ncbi:uncharacterized protein LOC117780056 [Drosophila innubila]|uniref:uncharacterized protein LOC117780056 n=1 Tax=Drosophila innubila TaxID=198719 RepID=UPI00148DCB99|nr:uncharacterized protein LOC117780056 [Drosophila innubila]